MSSGPTNANSIVQMGGSLINPKDLEPFTVQNLPKPSPKKTIYNRVTVVDQVAFAQLGKTTISFPYRYQRFLKSFEQPYSRETRADSEWKKVDIGWLAEDSNQLGMICIDNMEQQLDSPVEILDSKRHILEVSYTQDSSDCFLILPGDRLRVTPCSFSQEDRTKARDLFIRSQSGQTRYKITAIPK